MSGINLNGLIWHMRGQKLMHGANTTPDKGFKCVVVASGTFKPSVEDLLTYDQQATGDIWHRSPVWADTAHPWPEAGA